MKKYHKLVRYWLILGCVLLFFQIVIGGITRITGSGLSITKWEIVTGTLPPLNEGEWSDEFELYKATPQYQKINDGMSMSEFKFIYFWEYFHRLWARMMGLVFLIPLIFFLFKSYVDRPMLKLLGLVFFFAALAAVFGWIMVASGLVERPWVNAYKLSIHLGIALTTLAFLFWATLRSFGLGKISGSWFGKHFLIFFVLLSIQIYMGAIISGTRAALVFPTWPNIGHEFIPHILFNTDNWSVDNLVNYDKNGLAPALFHFIHRTIGYIVFIYGLYLAYKLSVGRTIGSIRYASLMLISLLVIQVLLGIITLLNSVGTIPVLYGVMHQAVAILLFCLALYLMYRFPRKSEV